MSDLSEVIVTADTHEQANCEVKTRVLCLQKFVEELGGCFQIEHLGDGYGLDYKVEGFFKDKEISLGIEYKQFLNDFVPNHGTLEKRLGAAREHYDNIALVIEGEQLARTSRNVGDKNIWYTNPAVIDGSADQMMNKQMFEDRVQIWTESGVLVRNIKLEEDFPDAFLYLLEYVTKDDDWYAKHKIDLPNTSFKNQYINTLLAPKIDKVGLKTAEKIIKNFPNLYWLCTYSEDDLKDALGKVTGAKLYQFIHNNDLITSEWENKGSKSQLSKETEKSLKSNPEQSSEVLSNNPELKYLDENKPKFIEVPKGCYVNGGEIRDINPERDQDIETLQLSKSGQLEGQSAGLKSQPKKEPTDNPASQTLVNAGSNNQKIIECSICGVESDCAYVNPETMLCQPCQSNEDYAESEAKKEILKSMLPETPDNSEFSANPRMKDVVEFIRKNPRTTEQVGKEFGFSPEYCLKALYALKDEHKKVWFEKSTLTWNFGIDKNPAPVLAEKEMDIGV